MQSKQKIVRQVVRPGFDESVLGMNGLWNRRVGRFPTLVDGDHPELVVVSGHNVSGVRDTAGRLPHNSTDHPGSLVSVAQLNTVLLNNLSKEVGWPLIKYCTKVKKPHGLAISVHCSTFENYICGIRYRKVFTIYGASAWQEIWETIRMCRLPPCLNFCATIFVGSSPFKLGEILSPVEDIGFPRSA